MAETLDSDEYVGWFSFLFPSHDHGRVALVSVGVGVAVFALGFGIAAVGDNTYLSDPVPYASAVGISMGLVAFGWAGSTYVEVWNEVRPAFAVDDETYRAIVHPRLEGIHDGRRILVYWAALAVPYFLVTAAYFLPGLPLHDAVTDVVLGPGRVPLDDGTRVVRVGYYYLFGAANVLVVATAVNGFANHLALVAEVAALPFGNVHRSATQLEPVAEFTVAGATAWFAGISLVLLALRFGTAGVVGTVAIVLLVVAGIVFFLAPQLLLHDALQDAKRAALAEVRGEYAEIHRLAQTDAVPPETISTRLDVTDRRLANAQSIRTWVYRLSSVGKLATAAVLPWLTLVREFTSTFSLLG